MVILSAVKKNLTFIGIIPLSLNDLHWKTQSHQLAINRLHSGFITIWIIPYPLSILYFLLFEANNFVEYSVAGFFCAVAFLHSVLYFILLWTRKEWRCLLQDFEEFVEKGEILRFIPLVK